MHECNMRNGKSEFCISVSSIAKRPFGISPIQRVANLIRKYKTCTVRLWRFFFTVKFTRVVTKASASIFPSTVLWMFAPLYNKYHIPWRKIFTTLLRKFYISVSGLQLVVSVKSRRDALECLIRKYITCAVTLWRFFFTVYDICYTRGRTFTRLCWGKLTH